MKSVPRSQTRSSPAPADSDPVRVVIPHPGPATFASGWAQGWRISWSHARMPFGPVRLWLAVFVAYTLARMVLVYMVTLAAWGAQAPDAGTQRLVNAAFWEVFGFFLAPAALTPWLAARALLANRIALNWRLVAEPFRAPGRWFDLVLLGLAWVGLAGLAGANAPRAAAAWGMGATAAGLATAWLAAQVVFAVATAAVWRDGLRAHRALVRGLVFPLRAWRPLSALLLSLALQAVGVLGALFATVLLPMGPALVVGAGRPLAAALLLLLLAFLLPLWHHHRAALALSVLDWATPMPPVPARVRA